MMGHTFQNEIMDTFFLLDHDQVGMNGTLHSLVSHPAIHVYTRWPHQHIYIVFISNVGKITQFVLSTASMHSTSAPVVMKKKEIIPGN